MIAPHAVARTALRCRPTRHLWASSSRASAFAYHSYTLPAAGTTSATSTTTAPPRNDDVPETSITKPAASSETLPKVHETRPPPAQDTETASSASSPSLASANATTTPSSSSSSDAGATTPTSSATTSPPPVSEASAQRPRSASRPRPKLRPRKAAMKLTPSAVSRLRTMLDGPDPKLIRVGVRNRGCSGLAYSLEYVEEPGKFDEAVEQDGVKVLVDSKALFSIIGSEMDWAEDKLNQRFVFKNPNIKEECGCGESFMV